MGYISQGLGKRVQDQASVGGNAHADDLEGCSMQIFFCTRSFHSSPSCSAISVQTDQETADSHCRKTKLAGETLSGGRHLWLRHRQGGKLVRVICREALFLRTNRKKTFQAFAERARTSEQTLAV